MFVGIRSKSPQLSALLIGASVLLGSGAIDIARADTDLGAVNITLTVNPGAPDQGGGPFQFALGQVSGGANLSALGIPSSVISWCVETTQNIGGGAQTYHLVRIDPSPSKIGGLIADGLSWLNIVSGDDQFTAANTASNIAAAFSAWRRVDGKRGWGGDPICDMVAIRISKWHFCRPVDARL